MLKLMALKTIIAGMMAMQAAGTMTEPEQTESNVGDGKEYEFIVSNVDGEEVDGIPAAGASDQVKGIFLYADEIGFPVDEGDKIGVTWGNEEDEFENIRLIEGGE